MTELSICILTRDNYETCKTTISSILKTAHDGFELLIIDASEKSYALESYINKLEDNRVRHVPVVAENRQQHWNQAIPECNGIWITFILDSDYIDPKIVEVIRRMGCESHSVESVGWNKVDYDWPEHRCEVRAAKVSMGTSAFSVDKSKMQKRFLGFEKEGLIPFNLYHGIVKRELVERIREKFGGAYFEHPITSYEFGYKVLTEANELAFIERPLSVLSAHSEDMLSEATGLEDFEYKKGIFYQDITIEDDRSKFPFLSDWSPKILGTVALTWLANTYGDEFIFDGWESQFVKRREDECNALYSEERFDELSGLYRDAIMNWNDGKFSGSFKPKFNPRHRMQKDLIGCFQNVLFLDKNAHGNANPAEFYAALENFITPTSSVGIKIKEKKRAA